MKFKTKLVVVEKKGFKNKTPFLFLLKQNKVKKKYSIKSVCLPLKKKYSNEKNRVSISNNNSISFSFLFF